MKEKDLILKVLLNYSILIICVVGLMGVGASIAIVLPPAQLCISIFNYNFSKKWQTVLMLEVNLLISTVLGLFFGKCLFLTYISDDIMSDVIIQFLIKIGAVLVFIMGAITTLIKYVSIKSKTNK